ncbi:MAG: hypothetical protein H7263_17425 [Candidatus Sericytochromatia bacterium]|nr:hypothetical protein [Candidatus Sericytochromatia bacterium]
MNKDLSKNLRSEESEDYNIDDIIEINKVDSDPESPLNKHIEMINSDKSDKTIKSAQNEKSEKHISFRIENSLLIVDNNNYDIQKLEDIDLVLKNISVILTDRVTYSVNKFSHMTHSENELKSLYIDLEEISKKRGSAKEIMDIASKIQMSEEEKNNKFISNDEIHKTMEDITLISSVLSKFQSILENNIFK